ncbi:hypothetical protein [Streptomyces sp. VRA16 Mangrove soil]|uniref:hypothetical protein n=1 Tax=Streptomyces sp. VRA16 Mangrove soil TaxID=2817434 RepID=UPI001A9D44C5|nr:hypothetical protein [Streptomyces sp. VRA16 Mangrove soil]MBO1334928.1 hypothetical protein [Streptomyces sp. VRA16 Mangrove soil]
MSKGVAMLSIRYLTGFTVTGAAVAALTLAGCSSGGGSSSGAGSPSSSPSGGSSTSSPSGTGGGGTTLTASKAEKVSGTVVTDQQGYVLYRFDADSAKPTKVTCYGTCAKLWPAATANGSITVKGIDRNLVSTVKRSDGTTQLTLNGWPLYRYSKDDAPREAYGQGVDGTWFAATPTGAKAAGEGSGSTGGSGY